MTDEEKKDDPEIEVELEEETPPVEEERDVCVSKGDIPPNCGDCQYALTCASPDKVNVFQLTQEPVAPIHNMAVDANALYNTEELADLLGKPRSTSDHDAIVDKFKIALVRHLEINPTKGLDACTSAVIYLQLLLMPRGALAIHQMQMVADILEAFLDLKELGVYSTTTTPIGVKPQ